MLCDLQCVQPRRFAIARNAPTIPKAELEAAHSRRRNLKRHIAAKTAGTFYPCLPSYFYQYHAIKPHCKAKQSLYTATRFTRFSILLCPDKVYVLTATNRIAMRFVARSAPPFHYLTKCTDYYKGGTVSGTAARRFANLRITPTIPKAELEAAHSRRRNLKRLTAAKTADMISHACRLIFINITLSNRIVKPNNRYTRQPASHDFPFYSAHDKVYVLTATNRIAMRFIPRCRPAVSLSCG